MSRADQAPGAPAQEVSDSARGRWLVTTESGSTYLIDLDAMTQTRAPNPETVAAWVGTGPVAEDPSRDLLYTPRLRRDHEPVPLLALDPIEVGLPMEMWLDLRGDGVTTFRATTRVTRIQPAPGGGDHAADPDTRPDGVQS
jgi:hypothetical protein